MHKERGSKAPLLLSPGRQTGLLQAGDMIDHRYEVLSFLGQGGMASVYKVRAVDDSKFYALKLVAPHLAEHETIIKRLELEGAAIRALNHPNVCLLKEIGKAEDGAPFLVMEYIDGESLDDLIQREECLDEQRALSIFIQIAEGLAHAHSLGIVHRDLKPANILLTSDSAVEIAKIVDFGIAKVANEQISDSNKLTQTGELIGSPLYMSPEQCRGGQLDSRSDIYSFGCIMYEVLSGNTPFVGDNSIKIILQHLSSEPLPLEGSIKPDLRRLVFRCLEKEAEFRYGSASALVNDLKAIRDGKPISHTSRIKKWKKFPRRAAYSFSLSVLLLLAAAGMFSSLIRDSGSTPHLPALNLVTCEWDRFDLSGIRDLNKGKLVQAEGAFKNAADLFSCTKAQKLSSMEKLAVLFRIKQAGQGKASSEEEAEIDENIARLQNEALGSNLEEELGKTKQELEVFSFASEQEQDKNIPALSGRVCGLADRMLKQERPDLLVTLIDKTIAGFAGVGGFNQSKYESSLLLRKAEALLNERDAYLKTRMLGIKSATALNYNQQLIQLFRHSIKGFSSDSADSIPELENCYVNLAAIYNDENDADSALDILKKFDKLNAQWSTRSSYHENKDAYIKAKIEFARARYLQKAYSQSLGSYFEALKLAETLQDAYEQERYGELISSGISELYSSMGHPGDAQKFFQQELDNKKPPLLRAIFDMAIADALIKNIRVPNEESVFGMTKNLLRARPYVQDSLEIRQHLEQSLATEEVLEASFRLMDLDHRLLNSPFKLKAAGQTDADLEAMKVEQESIARQTLAILERAPGAASSRRLAYAYLSLGLALQDNDKTNEAEGFMDKYKKQLALTAGPLLAEAYYQKAKEGNDPQLQLAMSVLQRGASCFARNDLSGARRFAEESANLVLQFRPEQLDEHARRNAAEILTSAACMQEAGSPSTKQLRELSDLYKYYR
jgi:serine/threonine protein kinase